jgi:glycosyltransferase involved in cell wall biosynthesis
MTAPLDFVAVSHFPPLPGGSARSCALLFRGIASRGHRVHLLGPVTAETASYDQQAMNPETLSVARYELPYFSISQYDLNEFLRYQQIEHDQIRKILPDLIDRARPQFVLCAHETLGGAVIDIAHAKGLPCALMLRGSPTWQIVTDSYPADRAEQYLELYRSADLVIPVGHYMQVGLEARGVGALHHIPNLLDLEMFTAGPKDLDLLDAYGIPRDSTVVLHASLMQSRKRPLDVIESAVIALPQDEKLVYLFLGGGERTGELQDAARSRGLGERVRFVRGVSYEQMPAHIRLADIVVLASAGEGIARVYVETQASARVLISSDIPAGREVIEHGRTGLLFRTGDPADLAAQILRAAGDRTLRESIGAAALQRVQQHDIRRVIDRYIEALGTMRDSS